MSIEKLNLILQKLDYIVERVDRIEVRFENLKNRFDRFEVKFNYWPSFSLNSKTKISSVDMIREERS